MSMGNLTRAERRRQEREKSKDTVYQLTKSQIDTIKRNAYKEAFDEFSKLEVKIRNEYEQQLNERVQENERHFKNQRPEIINYVIVLSLRALYQAFGWKVYKRDRYQRFLHQLMDIINNEELNLVKECRWVSKTLGIELLVVDDKEESDGNC